MSYVVLARKWRPQTFDDLTGQEHVAQTLRNAIERGRVPHAMLFTGARGVGKTSSARIAAMALNCATGPTVRPCGTCPSCTEIQRSQSVDVLEIDGASNRGINEIRELRDSVRYAPQRDRYKVYIIDEVHMLTNEAFNALLKTLEEPPPHVVFLFATTEAHKIPVTILSRCQRFDFRRIPYGRLIERLRHIVDAEGIEVTDDVLGLIARQAAGGMRDALSLLDQVIAFAGTRIDATSAAGILGAAERRQLFRLTDALFRQDVDGALAVTDEVLTFGVDLSWFTAELVSHLRDLSVCAVARDPRAATLLTDEEIRDAQAQIASVDPTLIHRAFEIFSETAEGVARSNHARLLFDMAIVRVTALEPVHAIRTLVRQLEALSRGERLEPLLPALAAPAAAAVSEAASAPSAPAGRAGSTAPAIASMPARPASPDEAPVASASAMPDEATNENEERVDDRPARAAKGADEDATEVTRAVAPPAPADAAPAIPSDAATPSPADAAPAMPSDAETPTRAIVPHDDAGPVKDAPPQVAPVAQPDPATSAERRASDAAALSPAAAAGPALSASVPSPGTEPAPTDGRASGTFESRWRRVIELANERSPLLASFARTGWVEEVAEGVRVRLDPSAEGFWTATHREALTEVAREVLGSHLTVDARVMNGEESAPPWLNVARVDDERQQAERRAREVKIREHASTRMVVAMWPAAQLDIGTAESGRRDEESEA